MLIVGKIVDCLMELAFLLVFCYTFARTKKKI